MPRALRDELDGAREHADELAKLIELRDFDEAQQAARRAAQGADQLAEEMQSPWAGGVKQAPHLHEAGALAHKIAQELAEMQRSAPETSPADRQKMGQLGQRQDGVRKRTRELSEKMQEQSKGALDEAQGSMQKAQRNLEQGQANPATQEAQDAAEKLGQVKRNLEESRRPRNEGSGARNSDEKIRIPGADEYRSPKLRQKVMDAMKREKPKGFEESVKRYYEELVK
jgi:hypothetical protein